MCVFVIHPPEAFAGQLLVLDDQTILTWVLIN